MSEAPSLFLTVRALIVSGFGGFSKASASIILNNINLGGGFGELLSGHPPLDTYTHIVAPTAADERKLSQVLGVPPEALGALPIVKPDWAVDCVRYDELLDGDKFRWRRKPDPMSAGSPKKGKGDEVDIQKVREMTPPREEQQDKRDRSRSRSPEKSPKRTPSPARPIVKEELPSDFDPSADPSNDSAIERSLTSTTSFEELIQMVKREPTENGFIPRKNLTSVSQETQQYWESQKDKFEFAHQTKKVNNNEHLTSVLEKLMKNYEILKDKGRFFAYRDTRLKAYPTRITSAEELRGKFRFGEKMLRKIAEILETGTMQRVQAMDEMQYLKSVKEISTVWGVGATIADKVYKMGYRSIADMKARPPAIFNQSQLIGLQFYEEFSEKMPREEVKSICDQVEAAAKERAAARLIKVVPCGSYRRGRAFCGDADMLMTFEDMQPSNGFLNLLVDDLMISGLITHKLQISEHWDPTKSHSHHMFAGVARLPGGKHRRLDIKIYPRKVFAWALLHFTGSANFNRSIRLFAKNKGLKLTDGGLYPTIRENGETYHGDTSVVCYSEEDIFAHFGIPYKTPEQRDI